MDLPDTIKEARVPGYAITPAILSRWSARALSGEALTKEEVLSLIEAARWAPSSANNQPWRFTVALPDSPHWDAYFQLLAEGNQSWARKAGALLIVVSRTRMEYKERPNPTHSLDTGAAWENLAIEATQRGYVVHGIAGFDYEKAREVAGIPDLFNVEMMIVIGKQGKKEDLPPALQERETPSQRKPLSELVFNGTFGTGF